MARKTNAPAPTSAVPTTEPALKKPIWKRPLSWIIGLLGLCVVCSGLSTLAPDTATDGAAGSSAAVTAPAEGGTSGASALALGAPVETRRYTMRFERAERTASLVYEGERVEPEGEWLVIVGEVTNPTDGAFYVSSRDFGLVAADAAAAIEVHHEGTRAAASVSGATDHVGQTAGMNLPAGSTMPLVLAFDVPAGMGDASLRVESADALIGLGQVTELAAIPTATTAPTATPPPTEVPSPTPQPAIAVVQGEALEARTGPGEDYDAIGVISSGAELPALGFNADQTWVQVLVEGSTPVWVPAEQVQLSNAETLGTTDAPELVASPTSPATATQPPVPTAIAGSRVVIVAVNKDAEYVDIQNIGDTAQNLGGWVLVSEAGNQRCALGGAIGPGETLRIHAGTGPGYSCGIDGNIWNNSERDPAVLLDASGGEVSRR